MQQYCLFFCSDSWPSVCCVFCACACAFQGILQGLELHNIYQLTVEFTRALRDAVKQLLRQYKLPEVRSSLYLTLRRFWQYQQMDALERCFKQHL